jgi:hypothetical protein
MRNWKIVAATFIGLGITSMAALAYAPEGVANAPSVRLMPHMSYAPSHASPMPKRVADQCIEHGQACVLNGTPCCNAADSCKGTFPNTYCQ